MSLFAKFKDNSIYLFLGVFIIIPLIICFTNLWGLPNLFIWYIPNIVMLYYGLRCFLLKEKNVSKTAYYFIYLYYFILFISCLLAFNKFESFFGSVHRLEGYITFISYFGFFCLGLNMKSKKNNILCVNILLVVSSIICLLCIFKPPFIYDMFSIYRDDYYFFEGPFFNFNHMGYYLLIVSLLSTFFFLFSSKKKSIFYYIVFFILLYTLVINDTFGAFLAYLFVILVSLIYLLIKKKNVFRICIVFISFVLVCFISYRDEYNVVYRNFSGLFNDVEKINGGNVEEINSIGTSRGELWINGAKYVAKKPLLGYGLENTKYVYFEHGINQSKPHNIILEQCLNSGVIGAFIYFYLIIYLIINQLRKINSLSNEYFVCLCIVVGFMISSLFGNSTFYISPYFYIILGLLAQNYKGRSKYAV